MVGSNFSINIRHNLRSFSGPISTFSDASSKSAIVISSLPAFAAKIAASFKIFARSAPTRPAVFL